VGSVGEDWMAWGPGLPPLESSPAAERSRSGAGLKVKWAERKVVEAVRELWAGVPYMELSDEREFYRSAHMFSRGLFEICP